MAMLLSAWPHGRPPELVGDKVRPAIKFKDGDGEAWIHFDSPQELHAAGLRMMEIAEEILPAAVIEEKAA